MDTILLIILVCAGIVFLIYKKRLVLAKLIGKRSLAAARKKRNKRKHKQLQPAQLPNRLRDKVREMEPEILEDGFSEFAALRSAHSYSMIYISQKRLAICSLAYVPLKISDYLIAILTGYYGCVKSPTVSASISSFLSDQKVITVMEGEHLLFPPFVHHTIVPPGRPFGRLLKEFADLLKKHSAGSPPIVIESLEDYLKLDSAFSARWDEFMDKNGGYEGLLLRTKLLYESSEN